MLSNIRRNRQQAKAAYDKHAKPLQELQVGEPVRLQPAVDPQASWEKGSCVTKVVPRSYPTETESGNLYRRNRKFLSQDSSQVPTLPEITDCSSTDQTTTADVGMPPKSSDVQADPKQTQLMTPNPACPQSKVTVAEDTETIRPQATVT